MRKSLVLVLGLVFIFSVSLTFASADFLARHPGTNYDVWNYHQSGNTYTVRHFWSTDRFNYNAQVGSNEINVGWSWTGGGRYFPLSTSYARPFFGRTFSNPIRAGAFGNGYYG